MVVHDAAAAADDCLLGVLIHSCCFSVSLVVVVVLLCISLKINFPFCESNWRKRSRISISNKFVSQSVGLRVETGGRSMATRARWSSVVRCRESGRVI